MIETFKITVSSYSRNSRDIALENSMSLTYDYETWEGEEDVLYSIRKTMRDYLNILHKIHGNWATYEIELTCEDEADMKISFSFMNAEYLMLTLPYNGIYTKNKLFKMEENCTAIKKKNSVINAIMSRLDNHIEFNSKSTF